MGYEPKQPQTVETTNKYMSVNKDCQFHLQSFRKIAPDSQNFPHFFKKKCNVLLVFLQILYAEPRSLLCLNVTFYIELV